MNCTSVSYQQQQRALIEQIESQISEGVYAASVVERRSDYESEPGLCLTSTCRPPAEIAARIEELVIAPLRAIQPSHHYYSAGQLHMTIKNIRVVRDPPDFDAGSVAAARELYARIIPAHPAFTFSLQGVLPLPTSLSVVATSNSSLRDLVQALDQGLKQIGLPDDKRYASDSVYFGNCTVCRYTEPPSPAFLEQIDGLRALEVGQVAVESVDLVSSNAVYTSLTVWDSFALAPAPERQ